MSPAGNQKVPFLASLGIFEAISVRLQKILEPHFTWHIYYENPLEDITAKTLRNCALQSMTISDLLTSIKHPVCMLKLFTANIITITYLCSSLYSLFHIFRPKAVEVAFVNTIITLQSTI